MDHVMTITSPWRALQPGDIMGCGWYTHGHWQPHGSERSVTSKWYQLLIALCHKTWFFTWRVSEEAMETSNSTLTENPSGSCSSAGFSSGSRTFESHLNRLKISHLWGPSSYIPFSGWWLVAINFIFPLISRANALVPPTPLGEGLKPGMVHVGVGQLATWCDPALASRFPT